LEKTENSANHVVEDKGLSFENYMSIRNDQIRNLSDITDSMLHRIQKETAVELRVKDCRVKNREVKN